MCCDHLVGKEWSGVFIHLLFWLGFVTCFCGEAVVTRKEEKVCFWKWNKQSSPTGMASWLEGERLWNCSREKRIPAGRVGNLSPVGQVYYTHWSFSFAFKEIRGSLTLKIPPVWAYTVFSEETSWKHIRLWEKSWNFDHHFPGPLS